MELKPKEGGEVDFPLLDELLLVKTGIRKAISEFTKHRIPFG
jgi:hypothetical protein